MVADGEGQAAILLRGQRGELFAFARIRDRWKDAGGNAVETCSILTMTPNAVTSAVHDRVILRFGYGSIWLTDYKKGSPSRIPIQQVLK